MLELQETLEAAVTTDEHRSQREPPTGRRLLRFFAEKGSGTRNHLPVVPSNCHHQTTSDGQEQDEEFRDEVHELHVAIRITVGQHVQQVVCHAPAAGDGFGEGNHVHIADDAQLLTLAGQAQGPKICRRVPVTRHQPLPFIMLKEAKLFQKRTRVGFVIHHTPRLQYGKLSSKVQIADDGCSSTVSLRSKVSELTIWGRR
mmetsp:Transcript_57086/g.123544  ORF Transcript_57086/g.123544 Transcript_57086/m.123544 type:complete len:200 (-) Transcript_57086:555-1154(-)